MTATLARIGPSHSCGTMGRRYTDDICGTCVRLYGRRQAQLRGRVRMEPEFAQRCFDALDPAGRVRFIGEFGRIVPLRQSPGTED